MRFLIVLIAVAALGQTPILITGPVTDAGGGTFTGRISISNPLMICGTTPVPADTRNIAITAGVLSTPLYATSDCTDAGGLPIVYTARLRSSAGGDSWSYLTIPATPASQLLSAVQTAFLPSSRMSLNNVSPGPVLTGQVPQWNGTRWIGVVPGSGGGGGGAWGGITGSIALQSDLMDRLNGLAPLSHSHSSVYAPLSHVHLVADVASLQAYLDDKVSLTGSYSDPVWLTLSIAKITGLPSALDLKLDSADAEVATAGVGLLKLLSEFYVDETTTPQSVSGSGAPIGACTGVRRYTDTTAHQEYFCDAGTWRAGGSTYTLPAPTTTVMGGVKRNTGSAGEYVYGIDTDGSLLRGTPAGGSGSTTGLYSGTLNFGAIPDLGCASLTLTATGLTAGKTLALSFPSALEVGLIGAAFASASDVATVRLCNVSGASIDPASATFAVRDMDSLGYLTASATINYGSIGDGNCAASTITLSGAASGDNVAAGWPAALEAGLTGSMFVSATDTVAVRVCNFSGAAVDPASATFKAAITR